MDAIQDPNLALGVSRGEATTKTIKRLVRFTPDILLRVRQMAEAGNSSIEIEKSLGSTPASVKNVRCRHKIKLPRRRRSIKKRCQSLWLTCLCRS
jgi:hypothetical protein